MRNHIQIFVIFILSQFLVTTYAMSKDPEINVAKGKCPEFEVLGKLRGVRKAERGLGYSFVLKEAAKLSEGPSGGAKVIQDKHFKLFSRVHIYKAEGRRVLVSGKDYNDGKVNDAEQSQKSSKTKKTDGSDGRLCGWISRDELLGLQRPNFIQAYNSSLAKKCSGDKPFRLLSKGRREMRGGPSQLTENCAIEEWYKERSPLRLRAIIHNLSVQGNSKIPLYKKPGDKDQFKSWKHFEIFDVFASRRIKRSQAENGRGGAYALIGASTAKGKQVHGWVHEDDIYIWNARMAVYWAGTGKAQGKVDGKLILTEPKDNPEAGEDILPRYPVTGADPEAADLNELINEEKVKREDILDKVNHFRVVAPGKYCKTNDDQDCVSSKDYDEIIAKVNNLIDQKKKVDVVFLIDGTSSMTPYFSAVTRAVIKLAKQFDTNEERDLRVAAILYGDYQTNEPSLRDLAFKTVVALHDPGESLNINNLARQTADMADPHNDVLEAPFAAIARLANESKGGVLWRKDSGFKFIIHIADHGNRNPGEVNEYTNAGGERKRLAFDVNEKGTWEHVAEVLQANEIVYAPVAVRGKFRQEANERFMEQASNIVEKLKNINGNSFSFPLVRSLSESSKTVERDIYNQLREIIDIQTETAKKLQTRRECAARGMDRERCDRLIKNRGTRVSQVVAQFVGKDLLQEALGPRAEIIEGRQQTVLEVQVRPREQGRKQNLLNYWMMVHEKDWQQLKPAFDRICNTFLKDNFSSNSYRELREGLAEMAVAATSNPNSGNSEDEEEKPSLQSSLRKIAYIFPGLTPDLEGLGEEFEYDSFTEEDRKKWQKKLCGTAAWFKRIDEGKTIGIGTQSRPYDETKLIYDKVNEKWRSDAGSERPYKWRYRYNNGMIFYFVPLKFFP